MMLAAPVWTLDMTGSSSLAAISGLFLYLPVLCGPPVGSLTDRLPLVGVLTSAQGAGSIVSGLLAGRLLDRFGAGVGALLFGVGTLSRLLPSVPVAVAGSLIIGIGLPWTVVAMLTAVQRQSPASLVGGVSATANMMIFAPIVLANPLGAALVELADHRLSLILATVATVALVRIR